jgi:hypothetical protein
MPNVQFHNLLSVMRKKGAILKGNRINKELIPPMNQGDKGFKLVFNFELDEINKGTKD